MCTASGYVLLWALLVLSKCPEAELALTISWNIDSSYNSHGKTPAEDMGV